jgi:hypothetical protein
MEQRARRTLNPLTAPRATNDERENQAISLFLLVRPLSNSQGNFGKKGEPCQDRQPKPADF